MMLQRMFSFAHLLCFDFLKQCCLFHFGTGVGESTFILSAFGVEVSWPWVGLGKVTQAALLGG